MSLEDYSESELLAELVRRHRQRESADPITSCFNCRHFVAGGDSAPEDYNPCLRGHAMEFRPPDEMEDLSDPQSWGFFLRACEDRDDTPAAPDPEPRSRPTLIRVL